MIINTKKLTKLLIEYDLSPEEFYILDAMYKKELESLKQYIESRGAFAKNTLKQLEKKKYIDYHGKDGLYNVYDIMITDKFYNNIYIDGEEAGEEFFKAYPSYITVDGKFIMSKKCDRDAYIHKYSQAIGFDKEKHQRIMKGLKVAKKRGMITNAIRNFIDSKAFEAFEELADFDNEAEGNQSFKKQI